MKKILLITILLIALANILLAEDMQLQEITLDELLTDYLPDYKIEKQIQLEGIGRDFAVAKDTGEIVAVTEIGNNFKVYYFDNEGNLKWEKEFSGKGNEIYCSISDNANSIIITNYISERAVNIVLNNDGNVLFEKQLSDIRLCSTPNGKYFYEVIGIMANRGKGVYIYDRYGNEIDLSGHNFSKEENIRLVFLDDEQLFSYMENKFIMFNYIDGFVNHVWNYQLDEDENLGHFFHNCILNMGNYIFISHHNLRLRTIVFSLDGEVIMTDNNYYSAFSSVNEDNLLAYSNTIEGTLLNLFNLETKKIRNFGDTSLFNNEKKNKPFNKTIMFDSTMLYSIRRFSWDKNKYSTLIDPFNSNKFFTSNYNFLLHENNIIAFRKFISNSEVIILLEGKK